jgi:hypothetical protein
MYIRIQIKESLAEYVSCANVDFIVSLLQVACYSHLSLVSDDPRWMCGDCGDDNEPHKISVAVGAKFYCNPNSKPTIQFLLRFDRVLWIIFLHHQPCMSLNITHLSIIIHH